MKDDIQFLKELQQELKTQDIDCQAAPRFWTIYDYAWEITEEGYHDRVSLFTPNDCCSIEITDYVEDISHGDYDREFNGEQLAELKKIYENDSYCCENDILEWARKNDDEDYVLLYEREIGHVVPNTMFITKAEAKRHLEANKHHYSNKAHTYAMTAWRAPMVERLWGILENFNWDSMENIE